jgi:ligand-binding sensor domain-containing protein/signal transduction histidine kinase
MKNLILTTLLIISSSFIYSQGNDVIKNYVHISKSDGLASNNVTAVCDDIYGRIWIGTASGLNIYDSNRLKKADGYSGIHILSLFDTGNEMLIGNSDFIEAYNYDSGKYIRVRYEEREIEYALSIFRFQDMNIVLSNGIIYKFENNTLKILKRDVPYIYLSIDKFGVLWGLNNDMVYRVDDKFNMIKTYKLKSPDFSPLKGICIFPDSKGSVWVGTVKDGLYRYNRAIDEFFKEDIVSTYKVQEIANISTIDEDRYDRLWIGHNSKLSIYDYNNNFFKSYMLENNSITFNTTITKIHKTKQQDMILGTFFTGFFYIKELNSNMKFYNLAGIRKETSGVTANGIIKDNQGRLWAGTNSIGISIFDKEGKNVKQIDQHNYSINNDIVPLEIDKDNNIWAGAMSNGLYKITANDKITHYLNHIDDENSLSGNTILGLHSINKDSLLIASNKGIDIYHHSTNTFSNIQRCGNQDFAFSNISAFGNKIYIVNFNSLYCLNRATRQVKEYNFTESKLYIQSAYINKEGQLWLGTTKGDLFLFDNGKLIPFLENKTLITSGITGIQGDKNNNLWLASGNNLLCVTPSKEIRRYDLSWGLGKNEFNVRSSYTDQNGTIFFGTSNGLFSFDPLQMNGQEIKKPILFISDFKIFNESVSIKESSLLKKSINNTERLILDNKQNFISFDISVIDYNTSYTTLYKCMYQLERFDNNWYDVNPVSNEISFTGLTTGKYTLHIKLVTNNDDILDFKSIEIEIKPPFLLSPYMILLYIVLLAAIVWLISIFIKKQRATKKLVNQAKIEQIEITRMNTLKLDFFTYISHEFKTPLAIISTLQDEILPFSNEQDSDAEIFKRNVKRLEYLINQLMEFRNIESQHASVDIKKYDMIHFLNDIYEAFIPIYKRKEITHQFVTNTESLFMLFDADKIEMLVGNLLSNTFKHTQDKGECYMKVSIKDNYVIVDVFNSGQCLTEEQKSAIFLP